jgi:hypothetical protein
VLQRAQREGRLWVALLDDLAVGFLSRERMPWEERFDRTQALRRAQRVFWKAGDEASSMNVLLRGIGIEPATGVKRGKKRSHA